MPKKNGRGLKSAKFFLTAPPKSLLLEKKKPLLPLVLGVVGGVGPQGGARGGPPGGAGGRPHHEPGQVHDADDEKISPGHDLLIFSVVDFPRSCSVFKMESLPLFEKPE